MAGNRDIVVIGASAGGVTAMLQLAEQLPAGLRASIFLVIHMSPGPSATCRIADGPGRLLAMHAVLEEVIGTGRNHLMLRQGYVYVVRGPKENGLRPSVNAVFRSAATAFAPRVIGIAPTVLLRRMAERSAAAFAERFVDKEQAQLQHADTIRGILLSGGVLSRADAPATDAAAAPGG